MFVSKLTAPCYLNYAARLKPICKISPYCLNIFKRVNAIPFVNHSFKLIFPKKFIFHLFCSSIQSTMRANMHPLEKMPDLSGNGPEANQYKEKLESQIKSINQWKDLPEEKLWWAANDFMEALGSLYLEYFQFHMDEAKVCAKQYAPLLSEAVRPIYSYISYIERRLRKEDEFDDLWELACWGRTNIEAFNEMFGQVAGLLEADEIEQYMNGRKGRVFFPKDLIPKNTPPESHWWWFDNFKGKG